MELGWSGYPGASPEQMASIANGVQHRLKAWKSKPGQRIMDEYVSKVLPCMWELAKTYFQSECDRMHDLTLGDEYGLCGTAWNKVTSMTS